MNPCTITPRNARNNTSIFESDCRLNTLDVRYDEDEEIIIDPSLLETFSLEEHIFNRKIGDILINFLLKLRLIQGFPWYYIGLCVKNVMEKRKLKKDNNLPEIRDFTLDMYKYDFAYHVDGSLRKSMFHFVHIWQLGCLINCCILCWFFLLGDHEGLSLMIGYLSWWFVMYVMVTFLYFKSLYKGKFAKEDDYITDAKLLKYLGVREALKVRREVSAPIWLLFSLIPALVSGFIVDYFTTHNYVLLCNEEWTEGSICSDNACCKVIDTNKFDFYQFFAFLTANIVGGYTLLKYSARLLFHVYYKHPDMH